MNKFLAIGNITADPVVEWKQGQEGDFCTCRFTLAITRPSDRERTDFLLCRTSGKRAEILADYVSKGDKLGIVGQVRNESYKDCDGVDKWITYIYVEQIDLCGRARSNDSSQQPQQQPEQQPQQQPPARGRRQQPPARGRRQQPQQQPPARGRRQQPQQQPQEDFMNVPDEWESELPFN